MQLFQLFFKQQQSSSFVDGDGSIWPPAQLSKKQHCYHSVHGSGVEVEGTKGSQPTKKCAVKLKFQHTLPKVLKDHRQELEKYTFWFVNQYCQNRCTSLLPNLLRRHKHGGDFFHEDFDFCWFCCQDPILNDLYRLYSSFFPRLFEFNLKMYAFEDESWVACCDQRKSMAFPRRCANNDRQLQTSRRKVRIYRPRLLWFPFWIYELGHKAPAPQEWRTVRVRFESSSQWTRCIATQFIMRRSKRNSNPPSCTKISQWILILCGKTVSSKVLLYWLLYLHILIFDRLGMVPNKFFFFFSKFEAESALSCSDNRFFKAKFSSRCVSWSRRRGQ